MQMFLVRARQGSPPDAGERIAAYVATVGGMVLMPAASGALVIGMPDNRGKEFLEANVLVGFVGGVQLSDGQAAARLRKIFTTNVLRQLAARGRVPLPPGRR